MKKISSYILIFLTLSGSLVAAPKILNSASITIVPRYEASITYEEESETRSLVNVEEKIVYDALVGSEIKINSNWAAGLGLGLGKDENDDTIFPFYTDIRYKKLGILRLNFRDGETSLTGLYTFEKEIQSHVSIISRVTLFEIEQDLTQVLSGFEAGIQYSFSDQKSAPKNTHKNLLKTGQNGEDSSPDQISSTKPKEVVVATILPIEKVETKKIIPPAPVQKAPVSDSGIKISGKTAAATKTTIEIGHHPVNRGELAEAIAKSLGLEEVEYPLQVLDVPSTHTHYAAIQKVLSAQILTLNQGNFYPDKPVTKAVAAVAVSRALNLSPINNSTPFKDVSINAWYAKGVSGLFESGKVKPSPLFTPNALVDKTELDTWLKR